MLMPIKTFIRWIAIAVFVLGVIAFVGGIYLFAGEAWALIWLGGICVICGIALSGYP